MITQKIRKVGNSLMVAIPREEAEAQGVGEGDVVAVEVRRVSVRPELAPRLRALVEWSLEHRAADLEYLKDK